MEEYLSTIKGVIEEVIFRNEENDYCVIEIVDDNNDLITCVGVMPLPFEGENVILTGSFTYHKEFGRQFSFSSFEKTLPDEIEGIFQYLSSKTIKGIGPVTAERIVNRFGTDTFNVIENHPEWLADIPGISMKKAKEISISFREQSGLRNIMMLCGSYIGRNEITKVYKEVGAEAVSVIKSNPYLLCEEEFGVPFEKVDVMARDFGIPDNDRMRVKAGVVYTLYYNANMNGHTCLPYDKLVGASAVVLGLAEEEVDGFIKELLHTGELSSYVHNGVDYVMKNDFFDDEEYIAKRIFDFERVNTEFDNEDIYSMIESASVKLGIDYARLQREAIFKALKNNIMILTGGPGTGKTTVVKGLISIYESMGYKCVLAAPTGRAAKRLSESTGAVAKTIHRLLEMERIGEDIPRFTRNASNPLEENVIIVDEASMIDLSLMASLFRALKRTAKLIIIGDIDQLPSVGAGNVLFDLISSGRITTVRLTEVFRQSKESLIISNAHRINNGEEPILTDTSSDFFFVRRENEREIPSTIATLINERLPRAYGSSIRGEIQVITPSKKGDGGMYELNRVLQEALNPPMTFKREVKLHSVLFREGDKVMQTSNNYEIEWTRGNVTGMGVFNGDIGVIDSINPDDQIMLIRFDDRCASYTFEMASELELAYAITVHKSQGSEYPVVIIPAFWCAPVLMTRNLFYTAVTRAKKMVIIVGRSDIPARMASNNIEVMRYTTLKYRLEKM